MVSPVLEQELHSHLEKLPPNQQRQVLDLARALSLARPVGVPGAALLPFAGTIEAADLRVMSQAAGEDCEQVHPQDW